MTDATHDQLHMREVDPLHDRQFLVRKRDGRLEEFNEARIYLAIESAFKAHHRVPQNIPLSDLIQSDVTVCAAKVVEQVLSRAVRGEDLEVERIQDAVENQLMLGGHLEVIRCYILYRDNRRRARAAREVRASNGTNASELAHNPSFENPAAARLKAIYSEALPKARAGETAESVGRRHFDCYLNEGDYLRCLTPDLLEFESKLLAPRLQWERDSLFKLSGLEILHDQFLARELERRFETPQYFWMRIAMGLALPERATAESAALRFYEVLSTLRFIPSEAILRNAGTTRPALIDFADAADGPDASRLEIWHRNVLDFLEGPSGELDLGLWIPDLFMKRLQQQGHWTLLDPFEARELNRCHGANFEARYLDYEAKASRGQVRFSQRTDAVELWQGVMGTMANTGKPGIVFKDAVHNRAPKNFGESWRGLGLARPSGAVNLSAHIREGGMGLNADLLRETVTAAVRMLDNALDASLYASDRSRTDTLERRAIGLSIVGFHETLARLQILPGSTAAADFADWSTELVSHCAILASAQLAAERGCHPGYAGSRWSDGILPIDATNLLSNERGLPGSWQAPSQDWAPVRAMIHAHGLRNGILMTNDSLIGAAKIAGVTPARHSEEADSSLSIECAARRQKWSDADETLALPVRNDTKDTSAAHVRAWEKGISRIQPVASARKSKHRTSAVSRQSKAVPAVPVR